LKAEDTRRLPLDDPEIQSLSASGALHKVRYVIVHQIAYNPAGQKPLRKPSL
jgi:hypothetical protein